MCGIFLRISYIQSEIRDDYKEIIDLVNSRGPDGLRTIEIELKNIKLEISCSVLNLRGNKGAVLQPVINDCGDILCWNGEVWDGLEMAFSDNDTVQIMKAFSKPLADILEIISDIRGPYSFIYLDKKKEELWYGRDCLGRRSLLKHISEEVDDSFHFMLSSVSNGEPLWKEVPANGLYCVDLSQLFKNKFEEKKIPYVYDFDQSKGLCLKYPYPLINTSLEPIEYEKLDIYVNEFYHILKQALYVRTISIPLESVNQPRLAILYSGGLDSSVLARIIHEILPVDEPVDLLNVAFENSHVFSAQKKQNSENLNFGGAYDCPDRITGLNAYKELCEVTKNERLWRFIQINVPYSEVSYHKSTIVKLMHPNDTFMDLSISTAFYFASRGHGLLKSADNSLTTYNSVSKVLIRADEQLGGYLQYLKRYKNGGWPEVIDELSCNILRLSYRNLGRDDRIVSHHGKEIRYPYLDENVVKFLCKLPVRGKMDFSIQNGDKLLLRKLCQKLGLICTSKEKKRAIQFGSRSAKMETNISKKVSGYDKFEK
ncbi:uncharacterized protein T551_02139 [Pneumocystis jirovecii RU7]|uniref:Asparagine synthetase domain-containing protein n=1 Tax=Pneumocystis jirovecii (strain RU7) TaxID=1408657 RepID=A0A0W4ZMD8_PNEJ7|nr:uncharacterized protein T551_02139 [Pneumocystis jirovecii RU7]KTW29523.1 hypothetical protein T551_02139 [Pneumocystis jirovecii RU7]